MFLRLLLLFTVVPLVELFLLIWLGTIIGTLSTIAIVIATGVLGAWLARREGLRTVHAIREDLGAGRMPTDRLVDGLLILVAGAVLLTPGLITDTCGFLLLVPRGRQLVRTSVARAFRDRLHLQRTVVLDGQWYREE